MIDMGQNELASGQIKDARYLKCNGLAVKDSIAILFLIAVGL